MAEDPNRWRDMVEFATAMVRKIDDGDSCAAKDALRAAAVALRDVLSGRLPDPERSVYVTFLLHALEQIDQNIDARKALGLWGSKRVPEDRDFMLFLRVGSQLDRLTAQSVEIERPVARAIAMVAESTGYGQPTIEKSWKEYGGEDAWNAAKNDA